MSNSLQIYNKYGHAVERGIKQSDQPRFNPDYAGFFNNIYRLWDNHLAKEPAWGTNSRERDAWLRNIWKKEPYLAGVINSVTQIDKNRGWTLTGGRNQVNRFKRILHNQLFYHADLYGWRTFTGGLSLAYYTSDLGAVAEVLRDTDDGPMAGLYFVDSTQCQLTGKMDYPLKFYPNRDKVQKWSNNNYFRITSMPQPDTSLYGLGFCAISRALELIKIMIGIYQYDNEMLLNQAPRGLLLLKGITEQQWVDTMTTRKARLQGDEQDYYGAIHVLATLDPGVELDAQLIALSQLPAEFNQQIFTDLLMYGYALIFGYDPREFWPVSSGSLGTATETEAQHRKAGGKGALDFALEYQEKLQNRLPNTISFEFEERDRDGELSEAILQQEQNKAVIELYESGLRESVPLLTKEQSLILLAEAGRIPEEWTQAEEDITITDTDDNESQEQEQLSENTQRAIYNFPDENIVQYKYSIHKGKVKETTRLIRKAGRIRKRSFLFDFKKRQTGEIDDYISELERLSDEALNGEINQDDYQRQLEILTAAILMLSLLQSTDEYNNIKQVAQAVINNPTIDNQLAAQELLLNLQSLQSELPPELYDIYADELANSLDSSLTADIYAGNYDDNRQGLLSRIAMWGLTAYGLYNFSKAVSQPETFYRWQVGPTEHCTDCFRLNGQVHTGSEWLSSGYRPQSRGLACKGYRCQCRLIETEGPSVGGF